MRNDRFVVFCGSRYLVCFVMLCSSLLISACGRKHAPATRAMTRVKLGYEQRGIASWYGPPYHGRATASGEIYDMERLTAAHPRLPFGVTTRVENLKNGKHVDVKINDRGPFVKGRIIDVSKAAARQIDLLGPGITEVRIKVIAAPASVRAQLDPGATSPRSRFSFLLRPLHALRRRDGFEDVHSLRGIPSRAKHHPAQEWGQSYLGGEDETK
jgi:hypothetical protein